MSKASKTRQKDKNKKEKAARKAAKRAQYEAFRDQGKNQKSKRFRQNAKKKSALRAVSHPNGKCGNPGCTRCFGFFFEPWLDSKGQPKNMPHKMWLAFQKQKKVA